IAAFTPEFKYTWGTYFASGGLDAEPYLAVKSTKLYIASSNHNGLTLPLVNPGNGAYFDSIPDFWQDAFIARFDLAPFIITSVNHETNPVNGALSIYPNPVSNNVNIKVNLDGKYIQLAVYNTLGELVYNE